MVRQCVDNSNYSFIRLEPSNVVKNFSCGDADLDDFILHRAVELNAEDNDPHTRLMYYDLMDIVT